MQTVRVEQAVAGPPNEVFGWFLEPALLTRWWPSEAETNPVVGGEYRMYWAGPDVTLRGRFTAIEPAQRLAFTWSWDHDDLPARSVEVSFAASADGTLVAVDHEAETDDEASDYRDGWTHFLAVLASALADA